MEYRYIGNSGLKVSEIALGSWLTFGKTVKADSAKTCIDFAYQNGVNFFDTANAYEGGEAERVLGDALKDYERSSYVVATKVFFPMGDDVNERGLSRKHIIEQCDQSLQRLGLDYIDLYQCHRPDPNVPLEETMRALDDLVRQGKILYKGVSEFSSVEIERAQAINREKGYDPLISNQPIYNMLERYIEEEVMETSTRNGMGQIVFSPLAQGFLTGKYKRDQAAPKDSRGADEETNRFLKSYFDSGLYDSLDKLTDIAKKENMSLTQLSLKWVLRKKEVSAAIVGARSVKQIEENLKTVDKKLSTDTLREIEKVLEGVKDFKPLY